MHFSFTTIYCLDGKYTPPFLNNVVGKYMLPLFHQNWKLFAPEPPTCEVKLYCYYLVDGGRYFNKVDLGKQWLTEHHKNRLSISGINYRLNQQFARDLKRLYDVQRSNGYEPEQMEAFLRSSKTYRDALQYALWQLERQNLVQHKSEVKKIKLTYVCGKNILQGNQYKMLEMVSEIHFPMLKIDQY